MSVKPTHDLIGASSQSPLFEEGRYFISGGTGFVGRALLKLIGNGARNTSFVVLSRDPAAFLTRYPQFLSKAEFLSGDVSSFTWPQGEFSHVIHAATDTMVDPVRDGRALVRAVVEGTDRMLEFSFSRGVRKFLYLSSGAVYGKQPEHILRIGEDFEGAPPAVEAASTYGNAKRMAEQLCAIAAKQGLETKIARLFAFVGENLPLDGPYAIGNFIRDALHGDTIRVRGDGSPLRTYLYEEDLAIWLAVILKDGLPGRAYNVGSDEEVDIATLARLVAEVVAPGASVAIEGVRADYAGRMRYVPSIARAGSELGLRPMMPLKEAIARTAAFHRKARR